MRVSKRLPATGAGAAGEAPPPLRAGAPASKAFYLEPAGWASHQPDKGGEHARAPTAAARGSPAAEWASPAPGYV
jgi:hypothetical protein